MYTVRTQSGNESRNWPMGTLQCATDFSNRMEAAGMKVWVFETQHPPSRFIG